MSVVNDEYIVVAHYFSSLDKGGAESRLMELFRLFDKSKFRFIFIVSSLEQGFYEDEIVKLGGEIVHLPSLKNHPIKYLKKWKSCILSYRINVLHSHVSQNSWLPVIIGKLYGIKTLISHARSSHETSESALSKKFIILKRFVLRNLSDVMISCSREAALFVFGKKALNRKSVIRLPNSINIKEFSRKCLSNTEARKLFNIPLDVNVIGTVANLNKVKNQKFLIKYFGDFKRVFPKSILLIAGEGPEKSNLINLVKSLKIEDVNFMGRVDTVPELLSSFDIFALTSFTEGAPGSAIEAQAAGCKVLLSDTITQEVNCNPSVVLYASIESTENWIEKTQYLIDAEKPDRRAMQCNLISNGYDIYYSLSLLENIYKNEMNDYVKNSKYY